MRCSKTGISNFIHSCDLIWKCENSHFSAYRLHRLEKHYLMKSFCYVVNFLTEGTTANFAVAKKLFSYPQHLLRKKLRSIVMNFVKSIDFLVNLVYNILRHIIDRSARMEISYKKLWILLIEKNISPATLRKDLNIATGTMTKMRRNEDVALSVLLRICEYLDCNIGDICDAVKTEKNI